MLPRCSEILIHQEPARQEPRSKSFPERQEWKQRWGLWRLPRKGICAALCPEPLTALPNGFVCFDTLADYF